MMAGRADPDATAALLTGVGVKLGFGLAFYFVGKDEAFGVSVVVLVLMLVVVTAEIAAHVRRRQQLTLFGALPLRLETAIPRLGSELVGAFEVALGAEQIHSAWVSLTCSRVHPAAGDSDRWETELWTLRTAGTRVAAAPGCTVTFALAIPPALPRSTYTPGMLIRDDSVEFDEWRVDLELSTHSGKYTRTSQTITVYAGESCAPSNPSSGQPCTAKK